MSKTFKEQQKEFKKRLEESGYKNVKILDNKSVNKTISDNELLVVK